MHRQNAFGKPPSPIESLVKLRLNTVSQPIFHISALPAAESRFMVKSATEAQTITTHTTAVAVSIFTLCLYQNIFRAPPTDARHPINHPQDTAAAIQAERLIPAGSTIAIAHRHNKPYNNVKNGSPTETWQMQSGQPPPDNPNKVRDCKTCRSCRTVHDWNCSSPCSCAIPITASMSPVVTMRNRNTF